MATPDAKTVDGVSFDLQNVGDGDSVRYNSANGRFERVSEAGGGKVAWAWNESDLTQFGSILTGQFASAAAAGNAPASVSTHVGRPAVQLACDSAVAGYHMLPLNLTLGNRLILEWRHVTDNLNLQGQGVMIGDAALQNGLMIVKSNGLGGAVSLVAVSGGVADVANAVGMFGIGSRTAEMGGGGQQTPSVPNNITESGGIYYRLTIEISQGASPLLWRFTLEERAFGITARTITTEATAAHASSGSFPTFNGQTLDTLGLGVMADPAIGAASNAYYGDLRALYA